jgi:AbrB family looped-hinge helix DNA binding protein
MRLQSENTTRKVDSLGRVSIPKSLRDRLMINTEDTVHFYLLEDDDGRQYVCFSNKEDVNPRYQLAAEVLAELGLEVPDEILGKLG